jgi:hypothetical protein
MKSANKSSISKISSYKNSSKLSSTGAVHTPKSKKGMGDYYGTGIVAKLGKMRGNIMGMQEFSSEQMKKAPRSLA